MSKPGEIHLSIPPNTKLFVDGVQWLPCLTVYEPGGARQLQAYAELEAPRMPPVSCGNCPNSTMSEYHQSDLCRSMLAANAKIAADAGGEG